MYTQELYHYGIRGQRHGVRRFQNEDGSLTPAGEARYLHNRRSNRSSDSAPSSGAGNANGRSATSSAIRRERDDMAAVSEHSPFLTVRNNTDPGRAEINRIYSMHEVERRQDTFRTNVKVYGKDMPAQQIANAIGMYRAKKVGVAPASKFIQQFSAPVERKNQYGKNRSF